MSWMRAGVEAMFAGHQELPGLDRRLGFALTELAPGRAVFEADADASTHNPGARVHGGFVTSLADSAMGFAYSSQLAEGQACTNVEVTIKFLRPVWEGRLRAEARVVKAGRLTGLAEAEVRDSEDRLVARAAATFLVLPESEAGPSP